MRCAAVSVTLLVTTISFAQSPVMMQFQGGGGPGGPGGGRMMFGDPDQMFNMFAKGKDSISRADLEPWQQRMFDRFAERLNITNGVITRDQFKQAMETRMREGGGPGGPGGPPNPEQMDRFLDRQFQRYDKNGDGLLDANEMPDALKAERDKWDANKDGFIDLNEYKAYARARFGQREGEAAPAVPNAPPGQEVPQNVPAPVADSDADVRRPVVFRAGKLPKELPGWFAQLDTDTDGQVGLYEWVKGAKAITEFRDMDGNDDGLLTAEEVLRFQNNGKSFNYNATAGADSPREPSYRAGRDGGARPWTGDRPRGPGADRPRNPDRPFGNGPGWPFGGRRNGEGRRDDRPRDSRPVGVG